MVSVLPESSAARAGVQPGDIIENLAGFTTREMSVAQARLMLAGDLDTSVRVSVLRAGRTEPQEIDIVRVAPIVPKVSSEKLSLAASGGADAAVAYLRVPSFQAGRAEELRTRLAQLEKQGLRRLVLDLRDSAVGEISEAVATAQLFMDHGTIATLRGQTIERQTFGADASKQVWKHPVTVLISNGTAGPAELVAAALADNRRAQTIGERSFGTASEQKVIPLEDGGAIILTVANYYSPGGKSLAGEGVTPQVVIDDRPGQDGEPPARVPVSEDPVVKKALELLAKPAVAPVAVLTVLNTWNEFLMAQQRLPPHPRPRIASRRARARWPKPHKRGTDHVCPVFVCFFLCASVAMWQLQSSHIIPAREARAPAQAAPAETEI